MPLRRRSASERTSDFDDVFVPYTDVQARWEAARCLCCHDAPCNDACDSSIDVRRFVQQINLGDVIGAAETIRRGSVFGGTIARVCDAGGACIGNCTRARIDRGIDIPGLQWYAIDAERRRGVRPLPVGADRGRSVAIVGGGPAGLAAGAELRRRGHRVTLFEGSDEVGGMLVHGIPAFRLPRDLVSAELEAIVETGIEVLLNQHISSLEELTKSYDAVIVAIGLSSPKRLEVDGEDLEGVMGARALLSGAVSDVGLRPMVVGGGTAAMDAATTALRLSGEQGRVAVLYRRAMQQMPSFELERSIGLEEGVVIRPLTVVERILGDRDGRVAAVRCRAVDLGQVDSSGRPGPMELSGGTFDLQATSVIVAAGDEPDPLLIERFNLSEAEPRCDENGRTEVEKLYLAGDVVGGPRTVGWAVQSGVRAAAAVDFDLKSGSERERFYPVLGPQVDLSVEYFGKTLPNPFLLSAAPCTDDLEMARQGLRAGWAGLVLRTTSVEGTSVKPKFPSIAPRSDGPRMLAVMGNIDLISEHKVDQVAEWLGVLKEEFPDRFIAASIMGENRSQWQRLTKQLVEAGADAIECSLSAPQGTLGSRPGAMLGQDHSLVRTVTKWVKEVAGDVPVVVKITPQVADVSQIAKAVVDGGGDGICAANSLPGLAGLDLASLAPLPNVGGRSSFSGMTGPAILPFSLRVVAQVCRATELPVTGSGGVESWRDALSMILLGARMVGVCTSVMHYGFGHIELLCAGLASYMEREGLSRLDELVGKALDNIVPHEELEQPGPVRARIDEKTCIACGRCYLSCRDGAYRAIAWNEETRQPSVSLERCTGCGLCSGVCPVGAISYLTLG